MSNQFEVKSIISKIFAAKDSDAFKNYIEYIRFPHFKNIVTNTKIDFACPFTIFIGQNGSGKSSALHALYGAPDGYSTGAFWFSTKVDPIEEGKGNPNCFVYAYKDGPKLLEVLKTRIKRDDPDYWEPSRPLLKYGMARMNGKRNPAIKKDVIYLDFRAELSAYDKYFYFLPFKNTITLKTKQDVIRKYSKFLKEVIDSDKVINYWGKPRNKKPEDLNEEAILAISKILSKEYSYCKLITHSFFSTEGLSIYFQTKDINYSEAFAGRGEFAIVKIVHSVLKASKYSLIILDEPEVSLHPGAQEQLKMFLLNQTLKKQLQVIVSTHSPKFAEYLPETAIKLFYADSTSKFTVKNECYPVEAFHSIGVDVKDTDKNIIIVEDLVSKMIIDGTINEMGTKYQLLFETRFYPGGSEEMFKKAVVYSEEKEKYKFLILDGDKRHLEVNPGEFTSTEKANLTFVKSKLVEKTGIAFEKLGFRLDSNSSDEDKINSAIKYLEFLNSNLNFFPGNIPEEIIWNEAFVNKILAVSEIPTQTFTENSKNNILEFTELQFGDKQSNSHQAALKMLVKEFIKTKDANYNLIVVIIKKFESIL